MQKEWLVFAAALAWPIVGLIGILILGPGGLLKGIIGELSAVATSIDELKAQVLQLKEAETRISRSTEQVSDLRTQLLGVEQQLSTVTSLAADLVAQSLAHGSHDLSADGPLNPRAMPETNGKTPRQLYAMITDQWEELCEVLKAKVGEDKFDARSVGDAASRLTNKRRKNPLTEQEAEHINTLFSTMKRFRRLQASMDDWLSPEVYESFANGVHEALESLHAETSASTA